jgi:hypothetical protein
LAKIKDLYGNSEKLKAALAKFCIAPEIAERIMQGADAMHQSSEPETKAAWMGEVMRRMDELLDEDTRHAVREACACCLGGKRLRESKAVAASGLDFEGKVRAMDQCGVVCNVALQEDGSLSVRFAPEGLPSYRCPCLPKAKEPLPITYCYCCGGHVKHHLQTALGRKLECTVRTSVLASGGKEPCTFEFKLS